MARVCLLFLLAVSLAFGQGEGCLLEVIAGGGKSFSGDGGPAKLAEFDHPGDAAARPDGSIYVADTGNGRVRLISPGGVITTILQSPEPARLAVSRNCRRRGLWAVPACDGPIVSGRFAVLNADGSPTTRERPTKAGGEVSLLVSGLGRPDVDVDALRVSDDVIPWPTVDLTITLSPAEQNAAMLTAQPLWARSRPGEIVLLVEVRFRIPEGAYISPNGNDAVLVRGEAWAQFDLYLE